MQPNPVAYPQNTPPQTPPPTPSAEGGSKMALWLIGGLILVILLIGGIYLLFSKNAQKTEKSPATTAPPVSKQLDDVSETEVEAVGVGDLESEFSSVDQDLKSL